MERLTGSAASPGVAVGPAFLLVLPPDAIPDMDDPEVGFATAAATAARQLHEAAARADERGLREAADILRAQALMASDPTLEEEVRSRLHAGEPLTSALEHAVTGVVEALESAGSDYLAARAADVREIEGRIRMALAGYQPRDLETLAEPVVVVAESLTAADTAAMRPTQVLGFVTEGGGPTGHVAVIARALGIPAVVGVIGATSRIVHGGRLLVDGSSGEVVVDPDHGTTSAYAVRAVALASARRAAEEYRGRPARFGERPMTVSANVGSSDEVEAAAKERADGIGLFRTEFLFLDTDDPPTEEAQVEVYRHALAAFHHPVVVRLFDIGGDKPARYLELPAEENPFLGVRGMRLYSMFEELAVTQARALLRAAPAGDLWVMAPMVATVGDVEAVRALFERARHSLEARGAMHGQVKLGIMIEVPAAALNATSFAARVDFFSIGTNDLTQYTLAVDRTSGPLAHYSDAADPAVLRLCALTAAAARRQGISASVCGEAASDLLLAPLFAAMGIDKLSVGPRAVNIIKRQLAHIDPSLADEALRTSLEASSAAEVRRIADEAFSDH
jgi:phosphoenolpyruvate-protein phosphotransferase